VTFATLLHSKIVRAEERSILSRDDVRHRWGANHTHRRVDSGGCQPRLREDVPASGFELHAVRLRAGGPRFQGKDSSWAGDWRSQRDFVGKISVNRM